MAHELKPISSDVASDLGARESGLAPPPSGRWPDSCVDLLSRFSGWRLEHLIRSSNGALEARLHRDEDSERWWSVAVGGSGGSPRTRCSDADQDSPVGSDELASALAALWDNTPDDGFPGTIGSGSQLLESLAPAFSADGTLGSGWFLRDLLPACGHDDGRDGFILECAHPKRDDAYHLILRSPAREGELRVGDVGIHDYVAGPTQWREVASVRARVMFALSLMNKPRFEVVDDAQPAAMIREQGLTHEQRERFDRDGFLVIPQAISLERVEAARGAASWFLELDPSLRDRWYFDIIPYANQTNLQRGGTFLELYQHQALWDVRMDPSVYAVFRDLWGRDDLWVTMDRLGYKPPRREGLDAVWRDDGCVHWDVELSELPLPFGVQGLVALTDAGEAHGTFQCAPGMHARLDEFIRSRGTFEGRHPGQDAFEMVPVELNAGDLLIWHHGLPHRTGPNRTEDVRLVLYLSMEPTRGNEQERLERLRSWRDRLPGASLFEGDPLRREERHGVTAELTELGQRLLGARPWSLDRD